MKKLLMLLIVPMALISCSSDDENGNDNNNATASSITVTIDGTEHIFDNVAVNVGEDGWMDVSATIGNDTSKILSFDTMQDETGSNAIYNMWYTENSTTFDSFNGGHINTMVNENSSGSIQGNFSGTLQDQQFDEVNDELVITEREFTNGVINISY